MCAVAVVVSLPCLAIQIRAQNEESRLSGIRESDRDWSELLDEMLDPGLTAV